ncbi:MAG TPA: DUF3500 domain-containing protein [Fimbriimonadaceae bacterium]|nr:DUF3500 domain-containing protein [Fimbriimonadaceae bacterium]
MRIVTALLLLFTAIPLASLQECQGRMGRAAFSAPVARQAVPSVETSDLALRFLGALDAEGRKLAQFPLESEHRSAWNYVPITRKGIALGQMKPDQRTIADRLLRSSLSDLGYKTVEQIRDLEDVLFEREDRNPVRDKNLYTFAFFGTPKTKGVWAWRFEGHHVSLNFTYRDGVVVSSSPQFLGSNPARIDKGVHQGRPLGRLQDLAFALLDSLDPKQRAEAVVGASAPVDIVTGNRRKVEMLERKGIGFSALDSRQKDLLAKLIQAHAEVQTSENRKRRMARVDMDSVVFAWLGSTRPGAGHYYRIQGSEFLIEYDNTQNEANHIHAVWRDFDGDFGEDVLGEHYSSHRHHDHDHR